MCEKIILLVELKTIIHIYYESYAIRKAEKKNKKKLTYMIIYYL